MTNVPFPVLDFPVYGLVEWTGSRWLASVEGQIGHPARPADDVAA